MATTVNTIKLNEKQLATLSKIAADGAKGAPLNAVHFAQREMFLGKGLVTQIFKKQNYFLVITPAGRKALKDSVSGK